MPIAEEDEILAPVVVGAIQQLEVLSAQGMKRMDAAKVSILIGATWCIREFIPTYPWRASFTSSSC